MKNTIKSWQDNIRSYSCNLAFLAILILSCTACASTKNNVHAQEQFGDPGKTEPLVAARIYSPDEPNVPIPDEVPAALPATLIQQQAEALADTTIYNRLESEPTFYYKGKSAPVYISEEISRFKTVYTIKEKGTVKIRFVVERDGSLTNPVILQSSSEILTKSSLAILNHMPYWRPGLLNGWTRRGYVTLDFNW